MSNDLTFTLDLTGQPINQEEYEEWEKSFERWVMSNFETPQLKKISEIGAFTFFGTRTPVEESCLLFDQYKDSILELVKDDERFKAWIVNRAIDIIAGGCFK